LSKKAMDKVSKGKKTMTERRGNGRPGETSQSSKDKTVQRVKGGKKREWNASKRTGPAKDPVGREEAGPTRTVGVRTKVQGIRDGPRASIIKAGGTIDKKKKTVGRPRSWVIRENTPL